MKELTNMSKEFMNQPETKNVTVEDLVREYKHTKDPNKVAAIFCMPIKEVKAIIKTLGL